MQIVILEDGETYGGLRNSVTLDIPDDLDGDAYDDYVRDHRDEGEPVVPLSDVLDSMKLALESDGLPDYAEVIVATVEDYVTNHYGG